MFGIRLIRSAVVCVALAAIAPAVSAQPIPPLPEALSFTSIAAGERFTCALGSDRRAYCWGQNHVGQLGIGDEMVGRCDASIYALGACARAPVAVAGDHRFTAITAGDSHACGIDEGGGVYCWGESHVPEDGSIQQCQWETSRDQSTTIPCNRTPKLVALPGPMSAISAGAQRTCALDAEGLTWCWMMHRLRPTPERVDVEPFTALEMGGDYVCGLTESGRLRCWSWPLGEKDVIPYLSSNETWTAVTVGAKHACGLNSDGRAFCWGSDADGALGIGPSDHSKWTDHAPRSVQTDVRFTSIVTGTMRTCAIDSAGALYCWGRVAEGPADDDCLDSNGVPGTDANDCTTRPIWVHHNRRFVNIAIGDRHQCGLTARDVAYCWGQNHSGELGDGTLRSINEPVAVRRTGVSFSDVRWLDARELALKTMANGGLGLFAIVGLLILAGRWTISRSVVQIGIVLAAAIVFAIAMRALEPFAWNRGAGRAVELLAVQPLVIALGLVAARALSGLSGWWDAGTRTPSTFFGDHSTRLGTWALFLVFAGWMLFGWLMWPSEPSGRTSGGDVAFGLAMLVMLSVSTFAWGLAAIGGIIALLTVRSNRSATLAQIALTLATLTVTAGMLAAAVLFWPTER